MSDISEQMDQTASRYHTPLATEVMPLVNFYPPEEYHQDYIKKNPQGYCHINVDKTPGIYQIEIVKRKELL